MMVYSSLQAEFMVTKYDILMLYLPDVNAR